MFPLQMCSCYDSNSDCYDCSVMAQYSQIIKSHHIKIDILSIDEIYITESFYVKQEYDSSISSLDFWLNHSLQSLSLFDGKGELNFTRNEVTNSSSLISVDFRNKLEQNQTTYFYLFYKLDKIPISENGGSFYIFEFESSITYFTEFHEISVKIPTKSSIHEEGELRSFYPDNATIVLDPIVYVSWSFYLLKPFQNPFCFVRFDKPAGNPSILISIIIPIVGMIFGISGAVIFMRRKGRKTVRILSNTFLNNTQKRIINLISENDGKMLQKELCSQTGFIKSRISRNLVSLEKKGFIKREKWGRNYSIKLTKTGWKVVE
ncbi:MAG: winged helix-turn-helix transcriptional regulator [Candidatus Heimdallarchaeota archaeon]|nr:winged helix-turn-helix transcriptional regulator [Candidatus Heimdallarchaeota archaeon]MCK4611296.1 winged helix-turn-helix transcriptional regulator [Candidatus Heimdallarchaeota archaeon]